MKAKINPPTSCPSCNFDLFWEGDLLYCKNENCSAQNIKKIEHFAKTLKIKGLGPKTIQKLQLEEISDIYNLGFHEIKDILNSEKLAENLITEIDNSQNCTLNELLPAFSIPLIGKTASEKICAQIMEIWDIDEKTCKKAGLGPKSTENLTNWLDENLEWVEALPFTFVPVLRPITKGTVCITGKLTTYKTKALAKKALEELGYVVKDNVTKDVQVLINESGIESAKTKKARNSGIKVINNINELMEKKDNESTEVE